MNAVIHTINAAGRAFVDFAAPMLIQSAALILILLLLDLVLRRRVRAVFRYWIWMLVLLKLMLPPSLCSPVSFGTWFGATLEAPTAVFQQAGAPEEPGQPNRQGSPEPAGWTADSAGTTNPIIQSFAPKAAPPITLVQPKRAQESMLRPETPAVTAATETEIAPAAPPAATLSWQALVLLAWAAVALALLLLLLQRAWFVRGLVAQAQEAPPKLRTTLDECRARMGLIRQVALRVSPNATSPAVCGLLHPVILIPKGLAPKLQGCDLRAVLFHELAHVKRGDLWVNLIQTLLQIVYFYNPLFWLANVAIRRVREQAVDETVLVAMGETARDYPETLLSVAKLAFRKRPTLSLRLIGVVESQSALSSRIKHILTRPLPESARLGLLGLLTIFLLAAVLLPMANAQPMTDRARNVTNLAEEEARRLNHSYIGTEHLLLALARQEDAISTQVLANLGVDIGTLRTEVKKFVRPGPEPVTQRTLPRTPRAKRVTQYAREEAKALNHDYLGTEHLLLGLVREKEGVAAQLLTSLHVTPPQIRAEVLSLVRTRRDAERNHDDAGTDSDGDGLSDFQEVHKYLTDPAKSDSDGDGTPDGDWTERREYTYSVRSIFRFLPPLDEEALNDDFQDARVLKQTDDYVEIEVIHYPLATVYESIGENRNWQQDYARLTEYLAPGVTTNWDAPMRQTLLAELKADGIDVATLSDKQIVEQVSDWLLKRSRALDKVFTTFYVHCPNGRPEVFPGLEDAFRGEFERDQKSYDWTIEEHFDHEVLGKGMFYNKTHGSCTSTAVYLTTALRALGIPTRMVLVSPAVDASDREQILMVKNSIRHNQVRETMLAGLRRSSHGFTNHTFNEVYIGNRWVRLDYTALGPPILGVHRFGLQTHLYTLGDLSDVDLAATWGVRYAKGLRNEFFQHSNPYAAVEIDDLFGVHSNIANPPFTAQDLGTPSKPDIFIFSPAQARVWDDILEIVKDATYNKTGRPHQREYYENLFEGVWQTNPGDILVLLFALDAEDRVPPGYEDLLPQPWAQIEARLKRGESVELAGEARDMKIILLATPRAAQLISLVQNSTLLSALDPSAGNKVAETRPGWLVEFANGVKVRLLGVCTHPSAGKQWWNPDGVPLETAPYETTGSRLEEEEGYVYYEFAAEILGGDHPSIRWKVPGGSRGSDTGQAIGSNGEHLAHTYAYTANQPLDAEVANVFLGLAADEWETRAVHARPDNEGSYTLKGNYAVALGSAYEREGHTYVPVTTNIPYTTMAKRLIAIDIEGNLHTGSMSGSGGNVLQSSTYSFDMPLGRIKEFRFQTRSYVWVEFHNVSLRRGQKTDFKVDFAAAYNPDAADSVTLPDVDREAVMLDLASGQLVEIPRDASETNMAEAILALGRGDLVHDGNGLILVRNATSEQAEKMTGAPFSTCPVGSHLPQVLQVTTAEGRRYEIEVLAVEKGKNCTLKISPLSADEDTVPGIGANLPNGVSVDFLAYSQLTSEGLKWWTPRGEPTTIPNVHEADVEGLGTILAFAIDPPDIDLTAVSYRSGDKRVYPEEWRLGETNIWFVALEDEGNYANLELWAVRWDFPVSYTVPISADDIGKTVPVDDYGISRVSLQEEPSGSALLTVHQMSGQGATAVAITDANGVRYPIGRRQRYSSMPNTYGYRPALPCRQWKGIVFEARRANSASVKYANVSLTPQRRTDLRVDVGALEQSWQGAPSDDRLSRLVQGLDAYAVEHDGMFPERLEQLAGYLPARGDLEWVSENVAYLGEGHRSDEPPGQPLAYGKELLARQGSTYVLYNNGLVLLEGPDRLQQLGLIGGGSGPNVWRDIAVSVPPDANDTRVLAPGIRLDGIGSAPDSRAFISTVREVAETEGRQYRFTLTTKAGKVLVPIYYASFGQADGKLWEKYTFDTYYHHRELEAFRFQWRAAAGEVAAAPTAHGEILAATANGPDLPPALGAPPGRYALAFDGKDDYLYVPDSESLRTAEQVMVEMWFKPQFPPGPYDHRPGWALLAKGDYLGTGRVSIQGFGIALNKHDDRPDSVVFDPFRATEDGLVGGGTIWKLPDDWMHLSETFQRDSFIPAPGQPLIVGRFLIPTEQPFQGQIAEIRIWDAAQSGYTPQYENAALTGTEPGLLACWTFEEGAGPIAHDLSPHANHARLGKSVSADEADPTWLDLTQERESAADTTPPAVSELNTSREARFTVHGTVTDTSGQAMEGVWVNVSCGFDQPQRAGRVQTDEQGRYELQFKSPWVVADADPYGVGIQPASVYPQMDGFYETCLRRKGNLALVGEMPGPDEQHFVADRAGVVLVNEPYELDFVMAPAARIEGQILDEAGTPVQRPRVWLYRDRPDYQPRPSVTSGNGWFTLERIPCGSFWFDTVRKHLVRSDAVTLARPGTYRVTLQYIQCPSGLPGLRIVAFETPAFDRSDPVFEHPRVVDPNGAPVAGAQVALCTEDKGVTISSGKLVVNRMGGGSSTIVETDDQGRFSFADMPEAFHIVAAHEEGFAWITNEQFAALPEIRLQNWGCISGALYIGRQRGADERLGLLNYINNNAIDQRIRYDYETYSDPNGRFIFSKVPPGWAEVGYMIQIGGPSLPTSTYTARTPVQVLPGPTARMAVGGQGRPVVGRFVPPAGYDGPVYFGAGLRALDTTRPERPTPDNYEQMSKREQQQWLRRWYETDEAEAYLFAIWHDPQYRHYSFRVQDDGTFRIEDVIPGQYQMTVWLEERFRGQDRQEEIGAYYGTVEIPAMTETYSDEPLDLGEFVVKMRVPLHAGDAAPLFEAKTLDGNDVRLADYRGRFVLLSFWHPESHPELDRLKELYETYRDSGVFQIIGLGGGDTIDEVRKFVAENNIGWPEVYFGQTWDQGIAKQYGLSGLPYILLIDPEGQIVATWLRGEELTTTVRDALANASLGISGQAFDPHGTIISRENLYAVARSADYEVGPEWFHVAESSADRVYRMVQIYAERYGEPGFERVLDDWVRWKYELDSVVERNSAMALFAQFCDQFDEEQKFDTWSDPRIRAIGLVADKLDAEALMDRYIDALRSKRSLCSSVGYRDAMLSIKDPIITGHEGDCLPASLSAVWYALRRADEKLDDRYPSSANVIESRLTPILIALYKKQKRLDLLDRAVLLGGPEIAEFLLKQDWQGVHEERDREIVDHSFYVNKWLLRLINLDDPAGETFRREHPELVLQFADSWAGHLRSRTEFKPPRFLLSDKERGSDSLAWRYWPRYSQKMDAIGYEGKRLEQKFSYLMMLEPYATTQMYFDSWAQVTGERGGGIWYPRDIIMGSVPVLRRRRLATMMLRATEERLEKFGTRNDQNREAWDRLDSQRTILTRC